VAAYFASDVHLRLDRPERGRRFARFVRTLTASDSLAIVGDLCDFWHSSRELGPGEPLCEGLRALAAFRARGGTLTLLAGNHDAWLGPYYERVLGVGLTPEPAVVAPMGVRVHLVHGHLIGARPLWKGAMESRAFLKAFRKLPGIAANRLGQVLDRSNAHSRALSEARHLAVYQPYARRLDDSIDIAVFGHVHTPRDETTDGTRLVILGGWQERSSYLKIDETGARLVIEDD
jgi:UDP-2,3-diacylglucosamine hydrolase